MGKRINTTRIGADFENRVFKLFSSLLQEEKLSFVAKKHSKIFQHKKYKCVGLDRTIDFDITIETYNPKSNQNEWNFLVIIECKCLTRTVDIADLDEFENKMNKISSSGIKGIMVTTKGFTQKSIQQAQKAHIALMVLSEEEYNWIVSRNINKPEHQMQILLGNVNPGIVPTVYTESFFVSLYDYLNSIEVCVTEQNVIDIPRLNKDEIKEKANELYKNNNISISSNDIAGEIFAKQYSEFRINYIDFPKGILGSLSFSKKVVNVSNEICSDIHRRNFTLAHELGHLYLHQPLLESFKGELHDYDEGKIANLSDKLIKRIETQANHFASYLLMPDYLFIKEVRLLFKNHYITKGYLYLDHQPCNKHNANIILGTLSNKFNVSKEVVKIRLLNEKFLIINDSEPQRINSFF